jgi:hypothetical protein
VPQESPEKKPPSRFPLQSPYIEKDVPFPEPSLHIFHSPQKRSPLEVSLTKPLHEGRCSISRAVFTYLSKSAEKKPLLKVPLKEPVRRERCSTSRAHFIYLSKVPRQGTYSRFPFIPGSPYGAPT